MFVSSPYRELIEETLPPEKQEALWEAYEAEPDVSRKYHMLLEFSSFLRQARRRSPIRWVATCAELRWRRQGAAYKDGQMTQGGSGPPPNTEEGSLAWELCRVRPPLACSVPTPPRRPPCLPAAGAAHSWSRARRGARPSLLAEHRHKAAA